MTELLMRMMEFLAATGLLLVAGWEAAVPILPLLLFGAFSLRMIDWRKAQPLLVDRIGIIALALLGILAANVLASVRGSNGWAQGLSATGISSTTSQVVVVTGLWLLATMCGWLQLSGVVQVWQGSTDHNSPPADLIAEEHHADGGRPVPETLRIHA